VKQFFRVYSYISDRKDNNATKSDENVTRFGLSAKRQSKGLLAVYFYPIPKGGTMKVQFLVMALLNLINGIARAKPQVDRFETYQALSRSFAPIELDDSIYEDLTAKPRDYHVVVLLTAAEAKYGCQLCRDFQPEWDLLARTWNKGANHDETRLLFGTLDFSHGRNTFQKVMVSVVSMIMSRTDKIVTEAQASNRSRFTLFPTIDWSSRES
jgi:hypothetical protein